MIPGRHALQVRGTFRTQDGRGMWVESPTLPPQAWKLMTAWILSPWSFNKLNSLR